LPYNDLGIVISPRKIADRLAIRELVDAYARCADRRDVAFAVDVGCRLVLAQILKHGAQAVAATDFPE
jgi:hypothetical protein